VGAKKILIFLGIASIALFLGLGTNLLARQQAKTAEQEKTKAAEQQKPPVRQKVRPADLQKPKTIKEASLSEHYKDWLTQDVVYIITDEERSVFLALTTDEERENFIEQFWARRNTDPREGSNEFKIEHYRRIAYANEHFASGVPGWKTDRGRTYILFGEPDGKESHPSGGNYYREFWEGGGNTTVYPFERWRYRHIDNVGDDVELEFVDKTFTNEYRLAMSPEEKDMLLTVPGAGLTESEELGLTNKEDRVNYGYMDQTNFQRSKDQPFERMAQYFNVQRPPQLKFNDLKAVVSTRVTYNQLPYAMRTDFIRLSSDKVLVPITIEMNNRDLEFKRELQFNRASVNVYGNVTDLRGMIRAEFEDTVSAEYTDEFFDQGKTKRSIYQHTVALSPGQRYRLDLVLKDINGGNVGSHSYLVAVPKFDDDGLMASSIILANSIKAIPSTYEKLEQFVIGDMKVQPNVKCEYVDGQVLIPYLQIYNAQEDQTTLEPSLQISYTVKSGNRAVFIRRTRRHCGSDSRQEHGTGGLPAFCQGPGSDRKPDSDLRGRISRRQSANGRQIADGLGKEVITPVIIRMAANHRRCMEWRMTSFQHRRAPHLDTQ
jgi:GWxTD domain-containing protein